MAAVTATSSQKTTTILNGRRPDERRLRTRPRRGGLLAFAGLMIIGSAVAVAVLVSRAGDTREVLAAKDAIAKGHTISRDDLTVKDVAGIDHTFPASNATGLIGSTALVDVVPDQVLTEAMVSKDPTPGPGNAVVGLNLEPSRVPSAGLDPGDTVDVIAVSGGDNAAKDDELDAPPILASSAHVYDIRGSATDGGGMLVTLVVGESSAARIAAYSTAQRIAIVETATNAPAGAP